MSLVGSFIQVSLDGYYADRNGDMSWAHKDPHDAEWNEWVADNAKGGGALVFGRITYDLMASWWPTPAASQAAPAVADQMNRLPKYVFSRTLRTAEWSNTMVLSGDPAVEIRKLKAAGGPDLTILGSGTIVTQLARAGQLDELQVVVNPLALGGGKKLLEGVSRLDFRLADSRPFRNGNVALTFRPSR